jgi:catechol 2,3-dioxygenase-like lactoylglutathione lyase family enzyme
MSILNIKHTDFIVMHTKDFARSVKFYEDMLGLSFSKKYGRIPGGEMETGNVTIQILDASAIGQEFRPAQAIAFKVDDVAEAQKKLEAKGVVFVTSFDSGVCHQAIFHDPDGNPLILHNRYAPDGQEPG